MAERSDIHRRREAITTPKNLQHEWKRRGNNKRSGIYDCKHCRQWTANMPLYRNEICPARDRRAQVERRGAVKRDKLVTRHPAAKPEDDRYMLDRWTPDVMHKTTQVFRVVKRAGDPTDSGQRWYRVECLCGWRSQQLPRPVAEQCPVHAALDERARHLKRDGERIEWQVYKGTGHDEAQQSQRRQDRQSER
jgi:hypothetical protein